MTRARRALAVMVATGALTLTGCGIEERIVHLQPAPTENADVGAPLRVEAAERIAARVLSQAAAADGEEARAAIHVGPALRVANVRAERDVQSADAADVMISDAPTVLAMSRGQEWPRAILVATLDSATETQHLHVLVSTGPTDQFKIFGTAPLLPAASVPGLGELAAGTSFEAATAEAPIDASADVDEYAKGLAFPEPGETSVVGLDDPYAESLKRNAAEQAEAFDDLADLAQSHAPIADSILSFETVDGGRIVFAQMVRTATITLTEEAKELKIEDSGLQELSGKEVVTESFTTEYLENVLFVAPASGLAQLIGAEELVLRAEGS
ncbi:MAG: hypothetical protein ABR500_00290 [Dermatophilaceae bacterium]